MKLLQSLTIVADSDRGQKRESNEDYTASDFVEIKSDDPNSKLDCGIIVLADGMGGFEMGEVASQTAAKIFIEEIKLKINFSTNPDELNFDTILINAVEAANREVYKMTLEKMQPMGTTLVGAVIINGKAYIVNVGDSRAYLIKPPSSIRQITKDQSAVQDMFEAKIITREQMKNHPRRNYVTKSLGLKEDVSPDIFHQDLKNDNILMLCSDGLFNMVDDDEIIKIVNRDLAEDLVPEASFATQMQKIATDLIALANKNGGVDNISVAFTAYDSKAENN